MPQAVKSSSKAPLHGRAVGRYLMFGQIGAGGTATVHFGRVRGSAGFCRTVALKRLHRHLAQDPYFVSLFLAEARTAARVSHPNVVPLIDVIRMGDGELLLVMEYVHGETLAALLAAANRLGVAIPPRVAVAIMSGALGGLHAAHEATDPGGAPLGLVHGDVSPQNVIVGADGVARLLDFGTARASAAHQGRVIGTPAYMAPEQLRGERSDRRSDVFGAGVVLWEMLAMRRLFPGTRGRLRIAEWDAIPAPHRFNPEVPETLAKVVLHACQPALADRPATALACALALEKSCHPASAREVAAWVQQVAGDGLRARAAQHARLEASSPDWAFEGAGPGEATVTEMHPSETSFDDLPTRVHEEGLPYHHLLDGGGRATPRLPMAVPTGPVTTGELSLWSSSFTPPPEPTRVEKVRALLGRLPGPRSRKTLLLAAGGCAVLGLFALRLERGPRAPLSIETSARTEAPRLDQAAARSTDRARQAEATLQRGRYLVEGAAIEAMAAPAAPATVPAPALPSAPVLRPALAPDPVGDEDAPLPPPEAVEPDEPGAVAVAPTLTVSASSDGPPSPLEIARRTIAALDHRAMQAYELLDRQSALRLLTEALRRCELTGLGRSDLAAQTHLALGVVLAGAFKQPDLGAKHFRLAQMLQPGLRPPAHLSTPDIAVALAASRRSDAAGRTPTGRRR